MALIRLERRGSLAVLRLDKARGNAIDEPLVLELRAALVELKADAGVAGVLLASGHAKLFSPGLDLVGLYEYDRPGMERFMLRFADMVGALFALPKPLVAAVSGHALAGGCILAMTADWRVLARGAQIGLNEVKVGVPLPWSAATLLRATSAPAALSRIALLGRNFAADEAVAAGLADEVADPEGFEESCLARLAEFAEKDAYAFARTKAYLRGDVLRAMRARERELLGEWLDAWFSPSTRARVRKAVEALAKR
jgi:enoyl-CoA hydratase/carnithine racemase